MQALETTGNSYTRSDQHPSSPPKPESRWWTPARILFTTFVLLALIAGLAVASVWFLLSLHLTLYIAAPLAFVALLAGLYLAYRSFNSPLSKGYGTLLDPTPGLSFSSQFKIEKADPESALNVPRILLVGDKEVGKTALATRYTKDAFLSKYTKTEYIDFQRKWLTEAPEQRSYSSLQIWDTEVYKGQAAVIIDATFLPYPQGGIMVAYDVTRRKSFEKAQGIIKKIRKKFSSSKKAIILVGCKSDLANKRQVSEKEARKYAEDAGHGSSPLLFMETSAQTGAGVNEAFKALLNAIDPPQLSSSHLAPARMQ